MTKEQIIESFVELAIQNGGWMELDRLYLRNRLLANIGEQDLELQNLTIIEATPTELLEALVEISVANGTTLDGVGDRQFLSHQLADLLTPPPSVVNALFAEIYAKEPSEATDYFYRLNQKTAYLTELNQENPENFLISTEFGEMQAVYQTSSAATDVSACQCCWEIEGAAGTKTHPMKPNRRFIRMNLAGESWSYQHSSPSLFREQVVYSAEKHEPERLEQGTIQRLLTILAIFPHYFVAYDGLTSSPHAHYVGGCDEFALKDATVEKEVPLLLFKQVKASLLAWPVTVIRLEAQDQQSLSQAAYYLSEQWQHAQSGNSVSVVARRNAAAIQVDLIFHQHQIEGPEQVLDLFGLMGIVTFANPSLSELEKAQFGTYVKSQLAAQSAFSQDKSGQEAFESFTAKL